MLRASKKNYTIEEKIIELEKDSISRIHTSISHQDISWSIKHNKFMIKSIRIKLNFIKQLKIIQKIDPLGISTRDHFNS